MAYRNDTLKILMLMAHTGGGHLRAAEAVAEALRRQYGTAVSIILVDALGDYAPFPFNRLASLYPWWIDSLRLTWRMGYRATDGTRRAKGLLRLVWPAVRQPMRHLLYHNAADVLVSFHPLTNHFVAWAQRDSDVRIPTLTVVTDPVSVHPFWLSPEVDRCLVATDAAKVKALQSGFGEDRIRVTGLPVNPCFVEGLIEKDLARKMLGWDTQRTTVMVIGGSEGMGRLYAIARAIDTHCRGIQLAVVAGRNRRLLHRLQTSNWRSPAHLYGFVHHTREMPHLMSAADLLVTKAGPATLHEAFLCGLPIIIYDAVPGQEDGNVRLVVEGAAGVWAPNPDQVAALVGHWADRDRGTRHYLATRSRALSRPDAAALVAVEIWEFALTNL